MAQRYRAISLNEPGGEGGGWDECSPDEAQCWGVEDSDPDSDWIVDVYNSRSEALAAAAALND